VFTFGPFGKRRWSYLVPWSESGISEKSKNGWQLARELPDDLTAQHIRELETELLNDLRALENCSKPPSQ
jgi:hypothetical protein